MKFIGGLAIVYDGRDNKPPVVIPIINEKNIEKMP